MNLEDLPAPHSFFPGKEGEDPPLVSFISVTRQGPTGPVYAPRQFKPADLPDLQALQNLFGGGAYVLQARNASGQIMAHFKVNLDGQSKPLSGVVDTPAQMMHAPSAVNDNTALILGMMQMMSTMAAESSKTSASLLTAMLSRSDSQQATTLQMISEMSRANQQSQADFYKHLSEMQGKTAGGQGSVETFKDGMKLGTDLADIVKEDSNGLDSSLGALMQGLALLKNGGNNGPPPAPGA